MPNKLTGALTPEQESLMTLGLPHIGPLPGIVMLRAYEEARDGSMRQVPELEGFYLAGKHPAHIANLDDLSRMAEARAVSILDSSYRNTFVRLDIIQPIDALGHSKGRKEFHRKELVELTSLELVRGISCTPDVRAQVALYPPLKRADAMRYLVQSPSAALNHVDYLSITSQVARGSRDATGTQWNPDRVRELAEFCRPRPSVP